VTTHEIVTGICSRTGSTGCRNGWECGYIW